MRDAYFILADPATGLVVRRARVRNQPYGTHLISLEVPRSKWECYAPGDPVTVLDLSDRERRRWLRGTH